MRPLIIINYHLPEFLFTLDPLLIKIIENIMNITIVTLHS